MNKTMSVIISDFYGNAEPISTVERRDRQAIMM